MKRIQKDNIQINSIFFICPRHFLRDKKKILRLIFLYYSLVGCEINYKLCNAEFEHACVSSLHNRALS